MSELKAGLNEGWLDKHSGLHPVPSGVTAEGQLLAFEGSYKEDFHCNILDISCTALDISLSVSDILEFARETSNRKYNIGK